MFTGNSTISFDPIAFGLNVLELDNTKLATIFTEDEINLIGTLSFFEETVKVPTIDNDGVPSRLHFVYLDSFAIGVYDYIRGCNRLMQMNDNDLNQIILEQPHIKDRAYLAQRTREAIIILEKYRLHCLPKLQIPNLAKIF